MTGVRAIRASGPCDDNGVASFDLVRHQRANESIFLYAFDLIELNGDDLRRDQLEVRKATLASIVAKAGPGIRFNEQSKYCRKSNCPTIVWLKSKNGRWTSNNITVRLLISGCSTVTMRGRVSSCARTSCPFRQIKR